MLVFTYGNRITFITERENKREGMDNTTKELFIPSSCTRKGNHVLTKTQTP